ncbi:dTDP-4-dehydrorhamnose 3,5-epimerase [Corynebacterium dentalis]|uniref:dTDP-4-dehydrorhamnose 3,5-epimerase n=1 Tax=Corynebacterium dentalis TaxID=2014528 RepID=UPI000C06F078|nr:dTDP-4-dehydrorhamnose 3,5-epimerase [Corynebacterium dentalis]
MTSSENALDFSAADIEPGSITPLPIKEAWLYTPRVFGDDRGSFHEWFRTEQFTEYLGYPFDVAQANLSRSQENVVRGIHLAEVPPGQAKFVTCVAGSVRDVLVDVRKGSPTYGKHVVIELNAENNAGVFVPLGVGHGFTATSDEATVSYLVTEAYNPEREFEINPFDATLAIDWGIAQDQAVLSEKDAAAPELSAVTDRLATWNDVRGWEKELRDAWQEALHAADEWEEAADE